MNNPQTVAEILADENFMAFVKACGRNPDLIQRLLEEDTKRQKEKVNLNDITGAC